MIGLPFNDLACLEAISRTVVQMVDDRDPILVELATQYPTSAQLVELPRELTMPMVNTSAWPPVGSRAGCA